MTATLQDRQDINDLMTGWIHRDLGEWELLRGLFHPDARIEITWFDGLAHDFVDASARMAATALRTKHLITAPVVTFSDDGTRAVTETNAVIIGENTELGLGAEAHNRFLDRVEKRDGVWRLADRRSVYDFSMFTLPPGSPLLGGAGAIEPSGHPREYAALAHLLEASGFPVSRPYATRGSDLEHTIKKSNLTWLETTR